MAAVVNPNDLLSVEQRRLCDVWDAINADIDSWNQWAWRSAKENSTRCGSRLCFAGHLAAMNGGRWASPPGTEMQSYLIANDGERFDMLLDTEFSFGGNRVTVQVPLVTTLTRASALAGKSEYSSAMAELVKGSNNLEDIRFALINHFGVDPVTRTLCE